jgi:ubiquinone/menaquinone biosynthesis C-methylase UbiE
MNKDQAQAYKTGIASLYTRRSLDYDSSDWHEQIARKLVDYSSIHLDARILDVATGTGMVAFYAESRIGSQGSVIGIDISEGMIERAKAKAITAGIQNIRFELGDAENTDFKPNSFDYIFCGSAFIWMTDLFAALVHWRELLKPNGKLGLHAFSENAFITGVVAQSVLTRYGVKYLMNKPTGTVEKCQALLGQAGYRNIEIKIDSGGSYISLQDAKNAWLNSSFPAPGQYPSPLADLSPEQLADAQADYERELESLNTESGIWSDMTTLYVFGEK